MRGDDACVQRSPLSTRERVSRNSIRFLVVVWYIALLAGNFGFSRVGLPNFFVIPERLFILILTTFMVVVVAAANGRRIRPIRESKICLVPIGYYFLTGFWGANVTDFWSAVIDIVCLLLACVTISILANWNSETVAVTVLWCLASSGIIYSFAGLAGGVEGRASAFGGGTNVYSRVTDLGVIAIIGLVATRRIAPWWLVTCPLMMAATLLSGSRGGMLAALVSILILTPIFRRVRLSRAISGLGVIALVLGYVYSRLSVEIDEMIEQRIVVQTLEQNDSAGRGGLYGAAWQTFLDHPLFGAGLRGFEEATGRTYPHNLFLQTAAEGGIAGLVLVSTALGVFVALAFRHRHLPFVLIFASAASVIFVSSMTSGDYYDVRFLWVFIVIAGAQVRRDNLRGDRVNLDTSPLNR